MKNIKAYILATRPWSFTVSVVPPILGGIIAINENPGLNFNWLNFWVTLTGCVTLHAATNSFSDYFDFKKGVDRDGTYGSSGVLTGKLLAPRQVLLVSAIGFIIAAASGFYLMTSVAGGASLVWLVLIGGFMAFFYTTPPFAIKYVALGDLAVFLGFGPLMTLGAYFVQAGSYSWLPALYAFPPAALVAAVLHGNNLRDIKADSVTGIKTMAILLKEAGARKLYYAYLAAAYAGTLLLVLFAGLTCASLLTLLSLPLAFKLIRLVKEKDSVDELRFSAIDAMTAQLHTAFSLLFIIALAVKKFVPC